MKTDKKKPDLSSIVAQTDENSGTNGDAIKLTYSEPMIIYTRSATIAGGKEDTSGSEVKAPAGFPGATHTTAKAAAANYTVTITPQGTTQASFSDKWSALGGIGVYDTTDVTHKTVLLLPPHTSLKKTTTAAPANGNTLTGTIWYTDGTTAPFTTTSADGDSYTSWATGLNLNEQGNNGFKVTTKDGNDVIAGSEDYSVTLASGSQNATGTKTYFALKLDAGTGATALGISTTSPLWVFPGTDAGGKADLYSPGDNIKVEIAGTVLDPAGNTLNTNDDEETAVAS